MVKTKRRKRRKSRKRIKTRRRRKLKYRGGGKNDKLICHIIKLIESIPKEDSSTPRPRVTSTGRAFLLEHSKKAKHAAARQAAIRQGEILWKEAGVNKLRVWAEKYFSSFCSTPWLPMPTSDSQDSDSDEHKKNRQVPE